jgi:exopolysaccharide production protein ExoZ
MKTKLKGLQSMRLFASLGVLQYHLWNNYLGVVIVSPGTDYFLILAGLVTALTQTQRIQDKKWGDYIYARYVRLYITYIPLFLITVLVKWHELSLDVILRSFFFIPLPGGGFPVIGAAWMMSMFLLFYLVFSTVYIFRSEPFLWLIFSLWAGLIVAYNWLHWNPGLPAHWSNLFFDERNINLLMGYAAGTLLRDRKISPLPAKWLLWIGIAGLIGMTTLENTLPVHLSRVIALGVPAAMFALGLGSLEQRGVPYRVVWFFKLPLLVALGEVSYVLYLSHGIVLHMWSMIFPITPALVPVISLAAVLIAFLIFRYWEKPLLQYFKGKPKESLGSIPGGLDSIYSQPASREP